MDYSTRQSIARQKLIRNVGFAVVVDSACSGQINRCDRNASEQRFAIVRVSQGPRAAKKATVIADDGRYYPVIFPVSSDDFGLQPNAAFQQR